MVLTRPLALAAAIVLLTGCGSPAVELPSIDGWTGEPQVAEAIQDARRAARREPTAANIGRLGELFHAHDLFREAAACYRRAVELAPGSARWPYLAALATRKLDLEPSLPLFELAIERGAEHPALFINLGDTLAQLDRPDEAHARYLRALELDPDSTHALLGVSRIELARGDAEAALGRLERARRIAPWHGEVRLLLARVYQRLDREADAERELLAAGAYPDPTRAADPILQGVTARAVNSAALVDRGRRLARAGRFAEAAELYGRVLEIRPGNAGDHSNLGGALARLGRTGEAIAQYRRALEIEPENPYALNNLAMAMAEEGDVEGAFRHLERALAVEPTYAEAHHNLGILEMNRGRPAAAVGHYRDALRHNPSLVQVYNDLGTALQAGGETAAARDSWRQALEIDPRELPALYNLSVALAREGDHAGAIEWLERGIEIAPNSSRLAGLLAWELATAPADELRDGARATELAQRVFDVYPQRPQAGDVYAASLAETGRFDEAAEIAGQAVQQALAAGQAGMARDIGARMALYRRGVAYRQGS